MPARHWTPRLSGGRDFARLAGIAFLSAGLMGAGEAPPLRLPPPPERAAFAVLSRTPYAELKFHDVYIRAARQNPGLNEIALDFTRPIEAGLIARLQSVLPEWIEYAYAGYDSAVIKTAVQADFTATPVPDGFLLRIERRGAAQADAALAAQEARLAAARGDTQAARSSLAALEAQNPRDPYVLRTRAGIEAGVGDWRAAERYYALARAEMPEDEGLRGSLAEARGELGPRVSASVAYRHGNGDDVVSGMVKGDIPVYDRLGALAELAVTRGSGSGIQQLDGSLASVNKSVFSGAAGITYLFDGGASAEAAALLSQAGIGARVSFVVRAANSETEARGFYHAGYGETASGVANKAFQDGVEFRHARRIAQGLWGEAALRLERYGVDGDEAAKTAGFTASLHYVHEFFGWSAGLSYEVEGEYVLDKTLRPDGIGGTFLPLDIRNREIHALGASASAPLDRDLWIDGYGGWAIDRYGGNGPFGGLALRYTPAADLDLSAGVSHSAVSSAQGSSGAVTTAGVNVIYRLQSGTAAND